MKEPRTLLWRQSTDRGVRQVGEIPGDVLYQCRQFNVLTFSDRSAAEEHKDV